MRATRHLADTRLLGVVRQIALLPLVYIFGRTLQGRVTGVIACALAAFSPYEIFLAREVRFYTEFAFFATLTCYFCAKA